MPASPDSNGGVARRQSGHDLAAIRTDGPRDRAGPVFSPSTSPYRASRTPQATLQSALLHYTAAAVIVIVAACRRPRCRSLRWEVIATNLRGTFLVLAQAARHVRRGTDRAAAQTGAARTPRSTGRHRQRGLVSRGARRWMGQQPGAPRERWFRLSRPLSSKPDPGGSLTEAGRDAAADCGRQAGLELTSALPERPGRRS